MTGHASKRKAAADNRFSAALRKASSTDFTYWFNSVSYSYELDYAIRYMLDESELLNEFDRAPLPQRQMFLQLAALSMEDEGL